jgi:hypothetical protein
MGAISFAGNVIALIPHLPSPRTLARSKERLKSYYFLLAPCLSVEMGRFDKRILPLAATQKNYRSGLFLNTKFCFLNYI